MKKIIALIIIIILSYAGLFFLKQSKGVSWFSSQVSSNGTASTDAYNIEMYGFDGRLYIAKHPTRSNMECIAITTSEGVGASCYKIK